MNTLLKSLLILLALSIPARAANTIITANITVTNASGPTDGATLTVNGDVRTWKNSVTIPASQILVGASPAIAGTNLFDAISVSPFSKCSTAWITNGVSLQTVTVNGSMTISLSAGWGTYTLSTNTLTTAQVVRVPLSVEYSTNQTNIATYLAQGLESSTYGISSSAPMMTNYVGVTNAQTISGAKRFLSPYLTNETSISGFFGSPILTNAINYGNGFSSPGTNSGSEQFGAGSVAQTAGASVFGPSSSSSGSGALAVGGSVLAVGANSSSLGSGSTANGANSLSLGAFAATTGQNTTAVGEGAIANKDYATALGTQTTASGTNSTALGQAAVAAYTQSTAIGYNAASTAANQIRIGTASDYASIPGGLIVGGSISNATFSGTNLFPAGSDVSFGRYALTSIANGNNSAIPVGTNVFIELSGPSGVFTINGIAGGRDGKFIILLNRTGQNMTIAHDSGTDPAPANRIYTLTAADKTVTGASAAMLIYNANVSRWILLNFTQ